MNLEASDNLARSTRPLAALATLLLKSETALAFTPCYPGSRIGQGALLKRTSGRVAQGLPSPRVGKVLGAVVTEEKGAALSQDGADNDNKFYKGRETPKVVDDTRIGTRKVTVVTGASSGLGLAAMKSLIDQGHFVIAAVRDPAKMDRVAEENGIADNDYSSMYLELASLQSVKDFAENLKVALPTRSINHLICNAAVYRPTDPNPAWSDDGFELSVAINHLGHFLLVQLLLPELQKSEGSRCIIVGSVTGNSNTIAGSFVKPVADVGNLEGLKVGGQRKSAMMSSPIEKFDGAKAYKDAKVLNMMTAVEMHRRYHKETGVVFSSLYPGCIAYSNLFREKRQWFRTYWPKLMKLVGAYVTEAEAGQRLAQTITDPNCAKSGVYWGWNGNAKKFGKTGAGGAGGEISELEFAPLVADEEKGRLNFEYSMEAVKDYL